MFVDASWDYLFIDVWSIWGCKSSQVGTNIESKTDVNFETRFLKNHAQTLPLPLPVTSKREFLKVTTATSESSKKFSVASHDMKFVFTSSLMIISISKSKRDGRTTLRSDSIGGKARKW